MTRKIGLLFTYIMFAGIFCFGCGKEASNDNFSPDTVDVMAKVISASDIQKPYTCYTKLTDDCAILLRNYFGFDEEAIDKISDITIVRRDGVSSEEYIILKTQDIVSAKSLLDKHLKVRLGDFTGYAPDEEAKLKKACVVTKGSYAALFVSNDSAACKDAFYKCIAEELTLSDSELAIKTDLISVSTYAETATTEKATEESTTEAATTEEMTTEASTTEAATTEERTTEELTTEELPKEDTEATEADTEPVLVEEIYWMDPYDTSQILKAYQMSDRSMLTDPHDLAVLDKCTEIIKENIDPKMSDYEKELAIHNYIINNADYDENALIYSDWFTQYADQPYGTLINGDAICLGYASSFKLLLNMLSIECEIVKGDVYDTYVYHAWNLVKLDDGWYAVDVTWDDPVNQNTLLHKYFNVTDSFLLQTAHHWNSDEYPAATGGRYEGLINK